MNIFSKLLLIGAWALLLKAIAAEMAATDTKAIPALWLIDAVLLLTLTWMVVGFFVPGRALLKVQGVGSLIVGVLIFLAGLVTWFKDFNYLLDFFIHLLASTDPDVKTLAMLTLLKIICAVLLTLSNLDLLKVKSLVLLVATSIGLLFVTAFVWKLIPGVSGIKDAAASLINITAGLVWTVLMMIASLRSVWRLWPRLAPDAVSSFHVE